MVEDSYNELVAQGFERVERDDRLLDVFPNEIREKGIELWDKWGADTVEIIRLHVPSGRKSTSKYEIPRSSIQNALELYQILELDCFEKV
ncbi:MAG: hypothetical protein O3A36_00085 [bacterium]|nr:hypothetical protein [bacterium]